MDFKYFPNLIRTQPLPSGSVNRRHGGARLSSAEYSQEMASVATPQAAKRIIEPGLLPTTTRSKPARKSKKRESNQLEFAYWLAALLILFLFLLTIALYLFIGFYNEHWSDSLQQTGTRQIRRVNNSILALEWLLNSTAPQIFVGYGPPNNTFGQTNALYLQLNSSFVYFKNSSSNWLLVTNSSNGPPGTPGPPGLPGNPGPNSYFLSYWMANVSYNLFDLVLLNGSLYYATGPNQPAVGVPPSINNTDWTMVLNSTMLISVGPVGPIGPPGGPGPAGPNGLSKVFLGAWNGATVYLPGNLVSYGNATFEALSGSLNVPPPTNGTSSSVWQLDIPSQIPQPAGGTGSQGLNVTGSPGNDGLPVAINSAGPIWNATVNYTANSVVVFNGQIFVLYPANASYSYGQSPPGSPWTLLYSTFTLSIQGPNGPPGGPGSTGNMGPPAIAYSSTWNSSQTYGNTSMVYFNYHLYKSLLSVNLGNIPWNSTAWQIYIPDPPPLPPGPIGSPGPAATNNNTWNNVTSYQSGNVVYYNTSYYISTSNITNLGNVPVFPNGTLNLAYWNIFAATNITATVGPPGPPGQAANSSALIGPVGPPGSFGPAGANANYTGPYQSATVYTLNQAVSYFGYYFYLLVDQSVGVTPFTNSSVWQLFLPAGLGGTPGPPGPSIPGPPGMGSRIFSQPGYMYPPAAQLSNVTNQWIPVTTYTCTGCGGPQNLPSCALPSDPTYVGCFNYTWESPPSAIVLELFYSGTFTLSSLPTLDNVQLTVAIFVNGFFINSQTLTFGTTYLIYQTVVLNSVLLLNNNDVYGVATYLNIGANVLHPRPLISSVSVSFQFA